jgi:hypothetical protein
LSSRALFAWLTAAALWGLGTPELTQAAPITVLEHSGRVVVRDDPFLQRAALEPEPAALTAAAAAGTAPTPPAAQARAADRNVRTELTRMYRGHQISQADYQRYSASFNGALNSVRQLRGTRAVELEAVVENLHGIAAAGLLTASRLPALFLTLDRNRIWWTTGPLLSYGQRVTFGQSQVVWQYYPGQGLQLQELGSWGQADGLYSSTHTWGRLHRLVDEMIPLGAYRGGGLTWEYYFHFDGGTPPWTSAMSQGTALQALTQIWEASRDPKYLNLARRALAIFSVPPPVGVGIRTRRGRRYVLYSFAASRHVEVINGFLQTLIGLFDYAQATGDPKGWALFHSGDREAQAELPSYDTGSWSLYQPGVPSSLDYHQLVTSFLEQLCARTHEKLYCRTAARFRHYLQHAPAFVAGDPATAPPQP